MRRLWSHKWFSILMALGITAILMIVVTALSTMYLKEYKISRLSYDEVLSEWMAEWMFEYGMLKIRNHNDGFADEVNSFSGDLDAKMFKLSTPRSEWMQAKYTIEGNSTQQEFTIGSGSFLVIPLGVGKWDIISGKSQDPNAPGRIEITENLQVTGLNDNIHWTISATDENGKNIGLQGKWEIKNNTKWEVQLTHYHCTDATGTTPVSTEQKTPCWDEYYTNANKQELQYSYRIQDSVENFFKMAQENNPSNTETFGANVIGTNDAGTQALHPISTPKKEKFQLQNFYLILYNSGTTEKTITIESDPRTPFALPQFTITSTATKGDASQVFKFSEDKSRILDALKYGYYDPTDLTP